MRSLLWKATLAAVLIAAGLTMPAGARALAAAAFAVPPTAWIRISAGDDFTCAIAMNHSLWCWGRDSTYQLGVGDPSGQARTYLSPVGKRANWSQVSAGGGHACAIRMDHSLWCWGGNSAGQLGIGTTRASRSPARVGTGSDWSQVSASAEHTCAITTGGTLWCWGLNAQGELGDGSTTSSDVPVQVGTGADWAQVSAGDVFTCAVTAAGELWCWGWNLNGELGDGSTTFSDVPVQAGTGMDWAQVSAGDSHACAITTAGTLWCWGNDAVGQLGLGIPDQDQHVPVRVGTRSDWLRVDAGDEDTCAIHADPTLECWGLNIFGELGDGDTFGQPSPVRVSLEGGWWQVSAGGTHTCGIRGDRVLWCWGDNAFGELGVSTGAAIGSPRPVEVG